MLKSVCSEQTPDAPFFYHRDVVSGSVPWNVSGNVPWNVSGNVDVNRAEQGVEHAVTRVWTGCRIVPRCEMHRPSLEGGAIKVISEIISRGDQLLLQQGAQDFIRHVHGQSQGRG